MAFGDVISGLFKGPRIFPAVGRPGEYTIQDFMDEGASSGVDSTTTTTAKMNHNGDTITLKNPYEGVTAEFEIKTVEIRSERGVWGWKEQDATTKKKTKILEYGDTYSKTLEEGTDYTPETGFYPERVNRDITITLVKYTTPEGTEYTGTGREVFFRKGGRYHPSAIINEIRGRRMVVGSLGRWPASSGFSYLAGNIEDREDVVELIKKGKVHNPVQAAMIRSAYAYDDAKRFKEDLPLRPY